MDDTEKRRRFEILLSIEKNAANHEAMASRAEKDRADHERRAEQLRAEIGKAIKELRPHLTVLPEHKMSLFVIEYDGKTYTFTDGSVVELPVNAWGPK